MSQEKISHHTLEIRIRIPLEITTTPADAPGSYGHEWSTSRAADGDHSVSRADDILRLVQEKAADRAARAFRGTRVEISTTVAATNA